MKFTKGDLLANKFASAQRPVARVERVTKEGIIHCVNLVACTTMDKGDAFSFSRDANTQYAVHSRAKSRR